MHAQLFSNDTINKQVNTNYISSFHNFGCFCFNFENVRQVQEINVCSFYSKHSTVKFSKMNKCAAYGVPKKMKMVLQIEPFKFEKKWAELQ